MNHRPTKPDDPLWEVAFYQDAQREGKPIDMVIVRAHCHTCAITEAFRQQQHPASYQTLVRAHADKRLTLKLTEAERAALSSIAKERGITSAGLIEQFISDLTQSIRSAGSDERSMAWDWLSRVVWPAGYKRFVRQYKQIMGGKDES